MAEEGKRLARENLLKLSGYVSDAVGSELKSDLKSFESKLTFKASLEMFKNEVKTFY